MFNLEVAEFHEYIANGFVVHNCEDCIDLASEWNPKRFTTAAKEASTIEQAVDLLILAEGLYEDGPALRAMWEISEEYA